MNVYPIETGFFKLDGGAMFGVVPKTIWQKTNPADSNNLCTWAMRCLLIENGNQLILIDTGIGNKQSEKFFSHYYLHGDDHLDASLKRVGFDRRDITDVFLTHLHFDHCGGAIERDNNGHLIPAFPNAHFWSTERHWQWATHPNPREKASFLKENISPIQESGQLKWIERKEDFQWVPELGFSVLFVDGHTESMMIPHIPYKDQTLIYMADLLPSTGHIPLAYVMGYDTRPLITIEEKDKFLNRAVESKSILFFEHDAVNMCANLELTERGVRAAQTFSLDEWFGKS
jgi:glyoxylase-like metal-dependent hydrolase (beta-lactamase superfamily II)